MGVQNPSPTPVLTMDRLALPNAAAAPALPAGRIFADNGIAVGDAANATSLVTVLGAVTAKIPVYDSAGTRTGWIPVFSVIL